MTVGNVSRGFEYGYGAYFGRVAAQATVELGEALLNARANRLKSSYEYREAGGEHVSLMTVTQGGFFQGSYLCRMVGKGRHSRREPLGSYTWEQDGRVAFAELVRYLNDGGTVEKWRQHNRAQAWIAWHQDWTCRIEAHAADVKRWLKDHPEGLPYANEQFKQAWHEWVGAATLAAAENPELRQYAATCARS